MINIRQAVYKSLLACEKDDKFSNLELSAAFERYQMNKSEKALFTALFYGVIEKSITIDYFIEKYTSKKISRLDDAVLIILRMGIFEILFFSTPDSAAVNEAVKLATRFASRAKGFINAVLRKVCTEKECLPYPNNDRVLYYSVKYSLPKWICKSFIDDYPDDAVQLMECSSRQRETTLRVNTLKTDIKVLLNEIGGKKCKYVSSGIISDKPISEIKALSDGRAFVQDEASQIQTAVLDARPEMTVIDVCACPGGKSFGAAITMENRGRIYSFDLHASKLPLISNMAQKLGIDIIKAVEHDSTVTETNLAGLADRVICDVPCSGLGVLSKKADLRLRDEKLNEDLPNLQYQILCASSKYLKVGGVLIYSTCTLRSVENEDVVTRFVKENPNYILEDFTVTNDLFSCNGMLNLFPHKHETDGFFIAKIKRNS